MRFARCLLGTVALSACGEAPDPTPSQSCTPAPSDDFTLGVIVPDAERWFRGFAAGCPNLEIETGLQGGWHVVPAVQAPKGVDPTTAGGEIRWTVHDANQRAVADAALELFPSFWVELDGGLSYWGDFVIFYEEPYALVGQQLTVTCELDFEDSSNATLQDVTIRSAFVLVDEDPTTVF